MVARIGPDALYRSLIARGTENTAVVTGSYAAREVAPVAVGGPLMIYVDPDSDMVDAVADELSLMRAAGGLGNVILLQSSNSGTLLAGWPMSRFPDGISAVDTLSPKSRQLSRQIREDNLGVAAPGPR
jgi:hypothetical protein